MRLRPLAYVFVIWMVGTSLILFAVATIFMRNQVKPIRRLADAAENFLGDMRCVPAEAVADLVNHLAARGYELAAGDFVSTGAATVPQPFVAGDNIIADFGSLGIIELQF